MISMTQSPASTSTPAEQSCDGPATFGAALERYVRRCGETMAAFAARVQVSPSTLSRVRTGQRPPTSTQVDTWAKALRLNREERDAFAELALLARTPPALAARLQQIGTSSVSSHKEADGPGYYDGFWLSYSYSFQNDGRVQRSLLKISGSEARLQVMDIGQLHYSYHGSFELLGDKAFLRLAEDRGNHEYVQMTLHTLFDLREPSFLHGLVCGISGKDLRHPVSYPAAAQIVLLHCGLEAGRRLEPLLGSWLARDLAPCWPEELGPDRRLRHALRVEESDDLDAVILGMIANRVGDGQVLRAAMG